VNRIGRALTTSIGVVLLAAAPSAVQQGRETEITLTGCLMQERDVPSRNPEKIDHAGILEDFVLTELAPAGEKPSTSGAMYRLDAPPASQLEPMLRRRVEVIGLTSTPKPQPPAGADDPLPVLTVKAIKAGTASCG
jgi:hypothetical protein